MLPSNEPGSGILKSTAICLRIPVPVLNTVESNETGSSPPAFTPPDWLMLRLQVGCAVELTMFDVLTEFARNFQYSTVVGSGHGSGWVRGATAFSMAPHSAPLSGVYAESHAIRSILQSQ